MLTRISFFPLQQMITKTNEELQKQTHLTTYQNMRESEGKKWDTSTHFCTPATGY
jgi:hypothetical protein